MHLLVSPVILGPAVVGVREDIVNMHDAAVQNGSSRRRPAILADRIPLHDFDPFRRVAIADRNSINPSILPVDEALVRAAEADRILHHVLQHRLEVERRAADDLEDFAGRRVLLQRFGELALRTRKFFFKVRIGVLRHCGRPCPPIGVVPSTALAVF